MNKLLFILPVLLLSSTAQIEAMQIEEEIEEEYWNNQEDNEQLIDQIHNALEKFDFELDKTKKEEILSNINKIHNKYVLNWILEVVYSLKHAWKKEEILLNTIKFKINDISKLRETASLFGNLLKDGKQGDLYFNIREDISEMSDYELYALSEVLDILPEETITEDLLFNLNNEMFIEELAYLYSIFCYLPEKGKTKDILLNISKMDILQFPRIIDLLDELPEAGKTEKILLSISKIKSVSKLYFVQQIVDVFYTLQLDNITEEILFNIINMNRYALTLMYYIFDKISNLDELKLNKIPKEILLNIIKYIIENNNISTLKDIESVLSNLPEEEGIKNLFINIRNNISKMDKKTLSNIDTFTYADKFCSIYTYHNKLDQICSILNELPSEDKTTKDILFKISELDGFTLYDLSEVIDKLPEEVKITEILTNIIKINDKDTLPKLYNDFEKAKNDDEKMQVLRKFGFIPEKQNI